MQGELRVERCILLFCLSLSASAVLAIGAAAQSCNHPDTYLNACNGAHPLYQPCEASGACTITVSKNGSHAGVNKPERCVDTKSYPTITWQADVAGRQIVLTFDRNPTGSGTVPYSPPGAGSVPVRFAKNAGDCFHYKVHYCKTDNTDCVDLDPKVIVNGGGGGPKMK
jgi:hypothetical protein